MQSVGPTASFNSSYVRIFGDTDGTQLLFDSGVVQTDRSVIEFDGAAWLPAASLVFVEVRVCGKFPDGTSACSGWSTESTPSVTGMNQSTSLASPIAPKPAGSIDTDSARFGLLRSTIDVKSLLDGRALSRAVAFITAQNRASRRPGQLLGAYTLFVDGQPLAQGPGRGDTGWGSAPINNSASPGGPGTAGGFLQPVDAIDVTEQVRGAANQSLVPLALGLDASAAWMELHLWAGATSDSELSHGLGGTADAVVGTCAPQWAAPDGITCAAWSGLDLETVTNAGGDVGPYYGMVQEKYNASLFPVSFESAAFSETGYNADPAHKASGLQWGPVQEASWFFAPMQTQRGRAVRVGTGVSPVRIVSVSGSESTWLVDFGAEAMALPRIGWIGAAHCSGSAAGRAASGFVTLRVRASEELSHGNDSDPSDTNILYPMRTDNAYESHFTFPVDSEGCLVIGSGSSNAPAVMGLQEYWEFRFLEVAVEQQATQLGEASSSSIRGARAGDQKFDAAVPFTAELWTLQYPWDEEEGPSPPAPSGQWESPVGTSGVSRSARAAFGELTSADFQGWFSSPHDGLASLFEVCKRTLRATSGDTVTDSNTRERRPYEGDMLVNLAHRNSLQRESMWGRHSAENVLLYHTWPTEYLQIMSIVAGQERMNAGTSTLGKKFFDRLYQFSMLQDYLDPLTGLVNFTGKARVPGTRDIIDWPQGDRDGYVFSDVSLVIQAHASAAGDALSSIAADMGNATFAQRIQSQAAGVRLGMAKHMWDSTQATFCDTVCSANSHSAVHSKMFPLIYGALANGTEAGSAKGIAGLTSGIKSAGMGHVSVYGAFMWINGLGAAGGTPGAGQGTTALQAVFNTSAEGQHSFAHMLSVGATMTREAWTVTEKPNLSWSHPWATAPVSLAMNIILGVRAAAPGFSKVEVAPQPAGLPWAEGAIPTVRGPVAVGFNCTGSGCSDGTGGSVEVRASFPPSTMARVCVPWLGSTSCDVTVTSAGAAASLYTGQKACGDVDPIRGRVCVDVDPYMWEGVKVARTV